MTNFISTTTHSASGRPSVGPRSLPPAHKVLKLIAICAKLWWSFVIKKRTAAHCEGRYFIIPNKSLWPRLALSRSARNGEIAISASSLFSGKEGTIFRKIAAKERGCSWMQQEKFAFPGDSMRGSRWLVERWTLWSALRCSLGTGMIFLWAI